MKIVFSKEEIVEILIREAEVMVGNYWVGEADCSIKESTNYVADVTVEVFLHEPITEKDLEEDLEIRQDDDGTDFFYDGDPLKGMPDETKS